MTSTNKLKIRKFLVDNMKPDRTILIVGKRGTGKTILTKDIMYHMRKKVDTGFLMTPTYDTQKEFEECLPKSHIYNEYSLEVVKNLIGSMESLVEQGKERHILLTLDDCMYDKSIMKSKEIRELMMNGRHLRIPFINSVQYLMDLGPDLRGQVDYVFCCREGSKSTREKLYKYFFGMFDKFSEFSMVMEKCTNNHEVLVLDATQSTNKLEDCIFYYKANPNIGRFRLGKSIYFKLDHCFKKQNSFSLKYNETTKLPEPVKIKNKIEHIEKEEE